MADSGDLAAVAFHTGRAGGSRSSVPCGPAAVRAWQYERIYNSFAEGFMLVEPGCPVCRVGPVPRVRVLAVGNAGNQDLPGVASRIFR